MKKTSQDFEKEQSYHVRQDSGTSMGPVMTSIFKELWRQSGKKVSFDEFLKDAMTKKQDREET